MKTIFQLMLVAGVAGSLIGCASVPIKHRDREVPYDRDLDHSEKVLTTEEVTGSDTKSIGYRASSITIERVDGRLLGKVGIEEVRQCRAKTAHLDDVEFRQAGQRVPGLHATAVVMTVGGLGLGVGGLSRVPSSGVGRASGRFGAGL
jgi:hypothetical protein